VTLLQAALIGASSILGVETEGESGGILVYAVLAIGTALTLLSLGLVMAATARALAEDHVQGASVGPTLKAVISDHAKLGGTPPQSFSLPFWVAVVAVIGFSMGAQQAFQWAVSYPGFMERIVATSGTAKTYGHGTVRLEGEIAALTADAAFKGGDYSEQPEKGIQAFAIVWTGWLFSQEWWRQELWRSDASLGASFDQVVERFRTNFIPGADANNLILQMRTWEGHDVGNTAPFHGDVESALRSIKARVLYMPSQTDLYFPVTDARYEAGFIPHCEFVPIPSLWGHPAGAGASPADSKFLNEHIVRFMEAKTPNG
jgi:homoserine acetyltransferase